ncbi:MAG: hypothetical protein AAF902_26255 [Chloroflexota bacterium]
MFNKLKFMGLMITSLMILIIASGCQTVSSEEGLSGEINVPQVLTDSGAPELQLREPEMLAGSAEARVVYDQAADVVAVEARYEGLPYRPELCYEYNPSNDYNQFPFPCVEDGEWQIWFVFDMFTDVSTFYYDADTQKLLGHWSELDAQTIENAIGVDYPTLQMVETPGFEPDPDTLVADVRFEYDFDNILDQNGTAGTNYAQVRVDLCDESTIMPYWTNGGLPPEKAQNFADIVTEVENGAEIMIALSYGPNPKPDYLLARDNIMIGWLGTGPAEVSSWPVSEKTETYHQTPFVPTIPQPSFESAGCAE